MATAAITLRYNLIDGPQWTMDRLIEETYLCLMKVPDYQKQASDLMYRIPVYQPTPSFQIKISHLSKEVKTELDYIWKHKHELDYVIKEAVGRIFANINERYFLLSVKQLLRVEVIA